MGSRANYLLIDKGVSVLWYSHWGAQSIVRDLFWGPELAMAFVRCQQRTEEWLDDVWCEGAALIDVAKKTVLLFGGEDIKYEPPLRRIYLELLRGPWSGWDIRWTHEGLVDIAEYAGLDRDKVLSGKDGNEGGVPGAAGEWTESVTSVLWEDGRMGLYRMNCDAAYQVTHGSDLLNVLRAIDRRFGAAIWIGKKPAEHLVVRELQGGGLHLDVKEKGVDFWTSSPEPDISRRAVRHWPGWSVNWHFDRYEDHTTLTAQRLTFENENEDELLGRVVEILEYELADKDRAQQVMEIAGILSEHDKKPVTINPNALIDAPLHIGAEAKREILHAARASYFERKASPDHRRR